MPATLISQHSLRGRLGLLAVAAAFASVAGIASAQQPLGYPRLANMYWRTDVDSTIIAALSRWDVVVLNSTWTNQQLAQLRRLNPQIKIYFYVIAYTVELPGVSADPWKFANYNYAATNDLWWYDRFGGIGSDWPNTQMCNPTAWAPNPPGGSWKQFIAARIAELVDTHPDLDGIFFDNFWKQISWQQQYRQLDSDCNPTYNPAGCNGIADSNATLDSLWNDALRDIAADVRSRLDVLQQNRPRPLAIVTNNASDYFESLNGAMIEYFPSGHSNVDYDNPFGYNWNQEMITCPGGYLIAPFRQIPYTVQVLNANSPGSLWLPLRNSDFERNKRFTLVSALLGDGYYSLDAGRTVGHGNLWWEPEFDHAGRGKGYLGQPWGPPVRLLQPTGPELVQNGDFSAGTTGWFGYPFGGTGTLSADPADYHSAPASARVDVTSLQPTGMYKVWQSNLPLVQHHAYTLSFWARAAGPSEVMIHLYSDSCPGYRCWNDRQFCLSTEWQHYEISFVSNGTAAAGLNLFLNETGSAWLDDVSLREGDTGLIRRDFDHGVVFLNYTNQTRTVDLGGTFWRLRIPGSTVFDGSRVTSEVVPYSDARIVLRDSTPPQDTSIVSDVPVAARGRNALWQNDPNPFNPMTTIRFSVAQDERVALEVFDVAGRRLRLLLAGQVAAGEAHRVLWDGRDSRGHAVPSGVYVYRLSSPSMVQSRKMILLR